jgi:hypothetical protein
LHNAIVSRGIARRERVYVQAADDKHCRQGEQPPWSSDVDRERFVEAQLFEIERAFALTLDESEARNLFLHLCLDTYDYLTAEKATRVASFRASRELARNPLRLIGWGKAGSGTPVGLSSNLAERWEQWNLKYFEVRVRNPLLELRDMMNWIGETDCSTSWPNPQQEMDIQSWIDNADPSAPAPFDDKWNIVTPDFFTRLWELRRKVNGWLFFDDEAKPRRVRFATEEEWQKIRAKRLNDELIREAKVANFSPTYVDYAALTKRQQEIRAIASKAKSDLAFWDSLRDWEIQREARRPPNRMPPSAPQSRSTPVEYRKVKIEHAFDQIFLEYVGEKSQPLDGAALLQIVVEFRLEMRKELGYDQFLTWPGGPDVGSSTKPQTRHFL